MQGPPGLLLLPKKIVKGKGERGGGVRRTFLFSCSSLKHHKYGIVGVIFYNFPRSVGYGVPGQVIFDTPKHVYKRVCSC